MLALLPLLSLTSFEQGGGTSPGFASGAGNLQLSASNKTWPRGGWALDFEPLVDAAIGRRPYCRSC